MEQDLWGLLHAAGATEPLQRASPVPGVFELLAFREPLLRGGDLRGGLGMGGPWQRCRGESDPKHPACNDGRGARTEHGVMLPRPGVPTKPLLLRSVGNFCHTDSPCGKG
jgi:hypothetical protein